MYDSSFWRGHFTCHGSTHRRYFATMGKDKGCCPDCMAGVCSAAPFEDCEPDAAWIGTIGLERPWNPNNVSPLSNVPGRQYLPEFFYKRDPFHVFKQSLAGHFISSAIVVMGELGYFTDLPGQSCAADKLLERGYEDFAYYVKHEFRGKSINHIKAFTKEILHWPRINSYPAARFKGSDAMMLLRWLKQLVSMGPVGSAGLLRPGISLVDHPKEDSRNPVLGEMLKACEGGLLFFQIMHKEGIWLLRDQAEQMGAACQRFCSSYSRLAQQCFSWKWMRFRMEPCLHHYCHFGVDIRETLNQSPEIQWIPSPAPQNCEQDEDFVGKVARLSRKVHMMTMTRRVIERYLIKLWFEFNEDNK